MLDVGSKKSRGGFVIGPAGNLDEQGQLAI